jgi:hypothetical protein
MMNVHGAARSLVVVATIFLASCTGGGGQGSYQPQVSSNGNAQTEAAIPDDVQPAPYDESGVPDPVSNTVVIEKQARGVKPQSVTPPGAVDGQAGITFDGHGRYTSLFAVHEVHPGAQIPFPPSSGGFSAQIVAPFSSAGCIAVGTQFLQLGSTTSSALITADNCNLNDILTSTPIDQTFTRTYVRKIAGVPSYVIQIDTPAVNPGLGAKWSALVFNFLTRRWNLLAEETSQVIPSPSNGYSAVAPFLGPGPCPQLPTFSAAAISLYDTKEHRWVLVSPNVPGLTTAPEPGPPGPCFTDNSTIGYQYKLERVLPDFYWQVDSVK